MAKFLHLLRAWSALFAIGAGWLLVAWYGDAQRVRQAWELREVWGVALQDLVHAGLVLHALVLMVSIGKLAER